MNPLKIQAQAYSPGRVKGPIRLGGEAATRDGIVVLEQHELVNFNGACTGLAIINGAPFSHIMIRIQGHGIPAIIITTDQAKLLTDSVEMVLDGQRGMLFDPELLERFPPLTIEPPPLFQPISTADDERVMLRASVHNRMGVMRSLSCGVSAIGLLHMEYLGSQSRVVPDADFFANELGNCCNEAEPLPLIARLPDYSTTKMPDWCKQMMLSANIQDSRGMHPYDKEPLQTLLNDILEGVSRCSEYYDLRILLPLINSVDEFIHWRDHIGTKLSNLTSIGAMLETVNAAEQINSFFKEADFIAFGMNDIVADLLNCKRDSEKMNAYEPVIYQLLQRVAQQAGNRTKEIQLNGQLARMPGVMPILLGLGYRVFSLNPLLAPYLRETVMQIDTKQATTLAEQVCNARDKSEVKTLMGL